MSSQEFDPQDFISSLVRRSLVAAEQARAQQSALASAEGVGREGIVEVMVDPAGGLTGIRFHDEASDQSLTSLTAWFSQAYRSALDAANRATAAAVVDPALRREVLDSAPAEIAADRVGEEIEEYGPRLRDVPEHPGIEDLPPDPEFDELLSVLDHDDPMAALGQLKAEGRFPATDFTRPDVDAAIRAELLATEARLEEAGPEIAAASATAENDAARATVGPWGRIHRFEFRADALSRTNEELSALVRACVDQAQEEAAGRAAELALAAGIDPTLDPTLNAITRKAAR